ncbi:ABC transporter permease subunit [Mycoplasma capricolum subsp. capricolum]|uniref:carbohydrate ABC transporter permease n=1 Tax=Mycoplasma capricolum TaxID=2095 RepID=UPI003DA267E3
MNNIEFYKSLKSKEEVYSFLEKISYKEFEELFIELDEAQKNIANTSYTFSNKEIAKIFFDFAKDNLHKNMYAKLKENFTLYIYKDENNKFVFNINSIENSFIGKDEEYIYEMFKIKARKQLAKIIFNEKKQELKNIRTKSNKTYISYLSFINKFIFDNKNKFINISYKIAKRKVSELNLLFSTNDYSYYVKSHNKNPEEFNNQKKEVFKKIKKDIANLSKETKGIKRAESLSEIYKQGIDYSYDWEVASLNAKAEEKYLIKKQEIENYYIPNIKNAKENYLKILKDKQTYREITKKTLQQAKESYLTDLEFATTKSEKKNLKLEYKQKVKDIKAANEVKRVKENLSFLKHNYITDSNKNRLEYVAELENIKNNLPIEYPRWKQVICYIFGWFPGISALINKQYKKASLLFASIPLLLGFSLYSWGIGNVGGNGILGLVNFGADQGFDADGRFFLVEGVLSIVLIFLTIIAIFAIWSDSINNAKKMRIGSRPNRFSQTRTFLKSHGIPYILSLPAIIGILLIVVVPIICTIIIAFTNYGKGQDPGNPGQFIEWIGIQNFKDIFGGLYFVSFKYVMTWTFVWVISTTISVIFVGSIFALLVNHDRLKGKSIFRLIFILPWAVPAFIMIMVFAILLSGTEFNTFTKKWIGVDGWTSKQTQARVVLILLQTWLGHSYMFLLITGVLQGISKDLYDSSTIDGASKWKQLLKITIPLILVQVAPLLVGQFVFNFGNFGIIYLFGANQKVLQPGGGFYPGEPGITDILISFVFKISSHPLNYRHGIAASFILFSSAIVIAVSASGFRKMTAFKN